METVIDVRVMMDCKLR